MKRYSEKEIKIAALYLIYKEPKVKMSRIISELEKALQPKGKDLEVLKGRKDNRFSQLVRNLKSHRKDNKMDKYTNLSKAGEYTITDAGKKFLETYVQEMDLIFNNNIDAERIKEITTSMGKRKKKLIVYDENETVTEGIISEKKVLIRERSSKLKNIAKQKWIKEERFFCSICGFDFEKKYGDIGKNYIEAHHIKPLFQYEDEDFNEFIDVALDNIVPLCANCHRMVHKVKEIDAIKQIKDSLEGNKSE